MENKTIEDVAREEKNRYHREWCARNREKVKAANERYWIRRAAAISAAEQRDNGNNGRKDAD